MTLQEASDLIEALLGEGAQLVRQGQPGAGVERFHQALELVQQVQAFLAGHSDVPQDTSQDFATQEATCLNNIGYVYNSQGNLEEALNYYRRALNIRPLAKV